MSVMGCYNSYQPEAGRPRGQLWSFPNFNHKQFKILFADIP